MVIQHQVSGPTVVLKSVSLLSFYVNALGSNEIYAAFFVVLHKKIPDLWLKGRCWAALVWYTGFQELVPWRWELHHQHAVQVAIHTNQNDVEITLFWSQQSHELTLTAESLDSPGLLKNGWRHPHSTTEHWEGSVAHTRGVSEASSRLIPGLLTQQVSHF